MYKIICDFCGTENRFATINKPPSECSNQACQNSLKNLEVVQVNIEENKQKNEENKKLIGLKLIYQKTSEEIVIKTNAKIIIGRESFGKEVLVKIKQISRSHCSVEFKENNYVVFDLDSTNGTFIGIGTERISCTTEQTLKDKDFLVLGQEVFLVQLIREDKFINAENTSMSEIMETEEPKEILCAECSYVLESIPCTCPDCGTWNE